MAVKSTGMLVLRRMEPKGTLFIWWQTQRAPKGRSALWKRPSKNPALHHLRMSVYCVTSLIKFPVILHKLLYKRVCALGKQNFCGTVANTVCGLFLWSANFHYFCGSPSCHEIFHTLCSSVYTCSNLDRRRFVMFFFFSKLASH